MNLLVVCSPEGLRQRSDQFFDHFGLFDFRGRDIFNKSFGVLSKCFPPVAHDELREIGVAKRPVLLCFHGSHSPGQLLPCHPSIFLKELPPELVEHADEKGKQPVAVDSGKDIFAAMRDSLG